MINTFLVNTGQKNILCSNSSYDSRINSTKTSYTGIDVLKFFFAICIVALHTKALDVLPDIVNYMITRAVFRVAVPYFFVATGFFLGKKLLVAPKEQYAQIVWAYCLRLLKPLIFFETVSLIYYGLNYLYSGKGIFSILRILLRTILFYPYGALWFVQACIIGVLLLYPFLKRDKLKPAIIIGVFLYGFALIANNYSFLITNTPLQKIVTSYLSHFISARNGLFTGFISIALGVLCSKIYKKVSKRKIFNMLVVLLFFVIYIAEIIFIYHANKEPLDDGALYISHLFFIPTLFIVTLQINIPISQKISVLFRNLSTGVYFLHRPILYISGYFISTGWLNFGVVTCVSVLLCLITYKSRFEFLRSLLK